VIAAAWGRALWAWFGSDDFAWLGAPNLPAIPTVLQSFVGPFGLGNAYRPVYRVVLWIDAVLFADNAVGWHAASLVLHLLCCVALFRLLFQLWGSWVLAVASVVIFASMPVLSDNVVWISGCSNPLGTLFAIVGLSAFDRGITTQIRWLVGIAAIAVVIGTAAYEPTIMAVVVMLFLVAARWKTAADGRFLLSAWIFVSLVLFALLAWRQAVLHPSPFNIRRNLAPASLGQDLGAVADIYREMFNGAGWLVFAGLPLLLGRRHRRLRSIFVAGVLASVLALLPYVPYTGVGLRFFYASCIGMAVAAAACAVALADLLKDMLSSRWTRRAPLIEGLATAIIVLGLVSNNAGAARAVTEEWVDAGSLSRAIVASVGERAPLMKGQTLLVLMDLPIQYRRAGMFYTQAERVFGRSLGPDHEFALPGHYLRYPAPFSVNIIKVLIGTEDARRASRGLPPLVCFDRLAAAITTVDGFVEKVSECDVAFLQIMPDGKAEPRSYQDFVSWYRR
jgi:hypothetical protein